MVAHVRSPVNDWKAARAHGKGILRVELPPMTDYNRPAMRGNRSICARVVGALGVGAACLAIAGCLLDPPNRPPTAAFTALPREGYQPLRVTFDAGASRDLDGDSLTYEWSFGDGAAGTGRTTAHTYISEGTYTVTLRVSDPQGETSTAADTIGVRAVPAGYRLRHYEWEWDGVEQTWEVLLPETLYQMYRGRLRTSLADAHNYGDYVLDPLDDPTLEDLANALWNRVGGGSIPFIQCTLAFVQGAISYRADPPGAEWPYYPIETLVDGVGDCEDTAILFVSLVRARGYPAKLAFVDTNDDGLPDHVLAFVGISSTDAGLLRCNSGQHTTVLRFDGELYAIAETTGVGGVYRPLGCDPWGLGLEDIRETWSF